ncbi:terminase family protein [Sphingomonas sp.]|uniref:DNA-packaging protein n=1 Tax=Sphingomonas sp. TaxID=28214 RepID=UPI001B227780|nr:terminase family protein [Sphingomonas sp.]MBO9715063.1 DNA-packaging protein [Sphingomonas sp.]
MSGSGERRAGKAKPAGPDVIERLLALSPEDRAKAIRSLKWPEARELDERWWAWALPGQREPGGEWRIWLIRAGRGFGKTRAGAEWLSEMARSTPGAKIALVGATIEDVRRVMIEGSSGLIEVARIGETVTWKPSRGELRFHSGARAFVYSATAPEKLRGPQHHFAWCDELGKWGDQHGIQAWDNLMLTLRVGDRPRTVVTTTPRPGKLMRKVMAMPDCHETRGQTRDNPHLPRSFVEAMFGDYAGTRLGRQELDGEMIDDVEGALWTRAMLEGCRVAAAPELVRVVVGVDPPASARGDACGIVAVGLGRDERGYVIEDASVRGASPERWARAVAACAMRHGADRVVAEKNQGGDMVRSVLAAADAALPLRLVHASKGKDARAEPVAALYEGGRVGHVGAFPELEDELCGLQAGGGYQGPGRSPDRADALVWALTELMLGHKGRAAVRRV